MELMTCARPYAQAVFQFALAQKSVPKALEHWSEVLKIGAAVVDNDAVKTLLGNPSASTAQKVELLVTVCQKIFDEPLDPSAKNLFQIVVTNQRASLLPLIYQQFEQLKTGQEKQAQAEVISAFPLTEPQLTALAAKLNQRLNTEVKLTSSVDESLLGGLVVRVGDLVIDSSVKTRLEKLAESMIG